MKVRIEKLIDARHTGRAMHALTRKYAGDMAPYASLSLAEIFEKVKNIPFQPDPVGREVIKRPYYTMHQIGPGGDCDDKTIALGAWGILAGIPYRFVGVGKKRPGRNRILLEHVFPEFYINGEWITADATYSFNLLGQKGDYDRIEIL